MRGIGRNEGIWLYVPTVRSGRVSVPVGTSGGLRGACPALADPPTHIRKMALWGKNETF